MNRSLRHKEVPQVDLHGAYIRRVTLRGAVLQLASQGLTAGCRILDDNLRFATDLEHAILDGADLKGAGLSSVLNLTAQQITSAVLDRETKLPIDLTDTGDRG